MDVFTKEKRSQIMAKIKGKDTKPEKVVRSLLHQMGYRFRLHRSDLPGNPDIVLPKHKKVIFVHDCFWHGHKKCKRAARPKTHVEFWNAKIDGNIRRDSRVRRALRLQGWSVLVVWQCELRNREKLRKRLQRFMEQRKEHSSGRS